MPKNSNEIPGLLNLPLEISTEALPRAIQSYDAQTKLMTTLSNTCYTLYNFFQPELEKRAAQQLLSLVLKPTKTNLEEAKKIYTANPKLLFIESIAEEYAAGLDDNLKNVHRIVQLSPIQAIAGADDSWLLKEVIETAAFKQYVDPILKKSSYKLAVDRIGKQFPNGFNYPPSIYNYDPLIDAITNDQSLIEHNVPSDVTKALLAHFRKHFAPDTVVTSGYFFNLNELVKTCNLYHTNWAPWQKNQLSLFWRQVIGYFQGLVSGVMGEVISQGIKHVIDGNAPKRQYNLNNYVTHKKELYFPLSEDPAMRVGLSFGVDSDYNAGCCRLGGTIAVEKFMSSNNRLEQIYTSLAAAAKSASPYKP